MVRTPASPEDCPTHRAAILDPAPLIPAPPARQTAPAPPESVLPARALAPVIPPRSRARPAQALHPIRSVPQPLEPGRRAAPSLAPSPTGILACPRKEFCETPRSERSTSTCPISPAPAEVGL